MAATALYATVGRIREPGALDTGYHVENGDGSAAFQIKGGTYLVEVVASTFGTVALQKLGPDGSTYIPTKNDAGTAISFTANGTLVAQLSAGTYTFALS
jgi:hypothetical protein